MANYIDNEILCEAYTHLNVNIYDDAEALATLKAQLLPYFEERAKFLLGEDVTVKIEFEKGSLKTKLQVIGSAGVILLNAIAGPIIKNPHISFPAAVIAYPSFKEGVTHLARDASSLAHSANLEVLFRTKTPYCNRVTIEKRKGIFGRVDNLLSELNILRDTVINDNATSSKDQLQSGVKAVEQLIQWNMRAEKLFDKIVNPVTTECISGGLYEALKRMPNKLPWSKSLEDGTFHAKIIASDPELFGELKAVSSRYAATLSSIKKNMKSRYDVSRKRSM